jgi:hypothetical protein
MPIRFRCAYCNQLMGIARRKAGTVVRCPKCAGEIIVPVPEGPEGPEDEPDPPAQPAGAQAFDVEPINPAGFQPASAGVAATAQEPAPAPPQPPPPEPPIPTPAPQRVGVLMPLGLLITLIGVVVLLLILMFVIGLIIGRATNLPDAKTAAVIVAIWT